MASPREAATSTAAAAAAAENDKSSPVSGISQFLGRVLEQLSLSSWMPAAMLVGNATVLIKLHSAQDGINIAGAFAELTTGPLISRLYRTLCWNAGLHLLPWARYGIRCVV